MIVAVDFCAILAIAAASPAAERSAEQAGSEERQGGGFRDCRARSLDGESSKGVIARPLAAESAQRQSIGQDVLQRRSGEQQSVVDGTADRRPYAPETPAR
jgi:hypothetical protein